MAHPRLGGKAEFFHILSDLSPLQALSTCPEELAINSGLSL